MQSFKYAAIGFLCLGGALLSRPVQSEDKPASGAMRVVLKSVSVAQTKKGGESWDINGGKPDLVISVKNQSDNTQKEVVTDEKTDAYEATYGAGTVLVSAGNKIRILVEDKDLAANDTIGDTAFEITADMLKKGKTTLTFGQVKDLTIEFQKP